MNIQSFVRLFKCVPIDKKKSKKPNKDLLTKTIPLGFVFAPEVVANYSDTELDNMVGDIEEEIGISGEKMNSAFHKSWLKVRDASDEQLFFEQIIHYITTYGFERLGIYDEHSVYIPSEQLDIPELQEEKIRLVVIRGYTKKELKEKLLTLLGMGVALKTETLKDVVDVSLFVELEENEIEGIKNKEIRPVLYDYFNMVPESPVEFLRYMIYKSTETTLLIKSSELIEEIAGNENIGLVKFFNQYDHAYGLERLAEIFYRFKPLFLAFRTNRSMKKIVNKIRRLATIHHKPMPEDFLNSITSRLSQGKGVDVEKLKKELKKVNIFRKIRLAYALRFREKDVGSILYNIRNGKGYVTDFNFEKKTVAHILCGHVIESIVEDIKEKVEKKKVYIPEFINYALPSTEKQFTGDFPSGTSVSVPKNMVFGIYWQNQNYRVDLDLSLLSADSKIGWDSDYRTGARDIMFSGDVTDAPRPRGASELFFVERQRKQAFLMMVNFYNYSSKVKVPYKIIVANEAPSEVRENYMVNPNNVVAVAKSVIDQKQKILGLMVSKTDGNKFYFTESSVGNSITSRNGEMSNKAREYLVHFYENAISLREVLEEAGAKFVDDPEKADIDLSPENIEKATILELLGV